MRTQEDYFAFFINALEEEIKAVKKSKNSGILITKGKFIAEITKKYIYEFNIDSINNVSLDSPAKIIINNKSIDCEIISKEENTLRIETNEKLTEDLNKLFIQIDLWFIYEKLKKKYEDQLKSKTTDFKKSTKIFNKDISYKKTNSEFIYSNNNLNDSQKKAINDALNQEMTIIWGPPGTGKTKTIASIVEAILNKNERVLLTSHSNTAVDNALENIYNLIKTRDEYKKGQINRMGIPSWNEEGQEKYENMILSKTVEKKAREVLEKNSILLKQKSELENKINNYNNFFNICNEIKKQMSILEEQNKNCMETETEFRILKNRTENQKEQQKINIKELEKINNSNALKRLISGTNPIKAQLVLNELEEKIKSNNKIMKEKEDEIEEINRNRVELLKEVRNLEEKKKQMMVNYQIENEFKYEDAIKELKMLVLSIQKNEEYLKNIEKEVIKNSKLIAATLTKTFLSTFLNDEKFDYVIVDEVSMASLPMLFWAINKSNSKIIFVGDFLQLPPICQTTDQQARYWLINNIFDIYKINSINGMEIEKKVCLLNTQYRMNPKIGELSNKLFYGSRLIHDPSTNYLKSTEPFSNTESLVLINTSDVGPIVQKNEGKGSKYNIYHALLSAITAKNILEENKNEKIGIITPYRAQAEYIKNILKDFGILEKVLVDTVHRFQGGERNIIIFDLVESNGLGEWSTLNNTDEKYKDANLLLNVGITRARKKLIFIANKEYIYKTFSKEASLYKILKITEKYGLEIESNLYFQKYTFNVSSSIGGNLYNDLDFWEKYISDIKESKEKILIMSPFLTMNRYYKYNFHELYNYNFHKLFEEKIKENVKIVIRTKPLSEHGDNMKKQAEQVISLMRTIGIEIEFEKNMHQKISIIDNYISWEGSLNILSHNQSIEQMRRMEGETIAKEIMSIFQSRKENRQKCNISGCDGEMILKNGKHGAFYGCSNYSNGCGYTCNYPNK